MNFRTTAILAALLAVVAVVVYIVSREPEPEKVTDGSPVITVDALKVTKISVTSADGKKFVMEKSGADWKILEPFQGLAEGFNVDSLVRAFTDLKARGEGRKSELKELKLDPPAWTVEMVADGTATKVIVGARPDVGDNLYVMAGDGKPMLVSASLCDQLEKTADSYRDMRLVSTSAAEIQQMVITQPDGRLVMQKKGSDWELLEPQKMPLDSSEVSNLTFAITGLRAAEFVSSSDVPLIGDPAKSPKSSVWFSTEAPTTQPATTRPAGTTVAFGMFDSVLKKNVYAYLDSSKTYAKVAATSLDAFNKKSLDIRDKKVMEANPAEVSRILVMTDTPAATKPADGSAHKELLIERRKENLVLGPEAPPAPTTRPTTGPTTRPTTLATTQPTEPPPPVSKWVLKSQKNAEAGEAKVDALLAKFNPLRADKYLEPSKATTQPTATYTVEIATEAAGKTTTHRVSIVDPGSEKPLIGAYKDLRFELPRTLIEDITGDFTNKPAAPAIPAMPPIPHP